MATTNTPKTPATPKVKKAADPQITRIVDTMKRSALQGKLTAAELDTIANLAASLKVFVSA